MAASVVYTNFAGQIAVENRGGTVKEYVPDTLGSTVALTTAISITDTWDYWPYGEVMTRTGSTPTPFTFVGVLGYFKDLLDKLFYVRARHYEPNYGRWLTMDPMPTFGDEYRYCANLPNVIDDRLGLLPPFLDLIKQCGLGIVQGIGTLVDAWNRGQKLDWKELVCDLAPSCLAALMAFLLLSIFPEIGILGSCFLTGIVSGIVNAGFAALCGPQDPCSPAVSLACSIQSGILGALAGCLSGTLGGGGLQVFDTVIGSVLNFLFGEAAANCSNRYAEGNEILPDLSIPLVVL